MPQYKDKLSDYIGVASDADSPNDKILGLIKEYASDATTLPIVMLLDKSGKCVGALYGSITAKQFEGLIDKAK